MVTSGVVGSLRDITTSLAVTSGSLQLAHSSISGVFDLLDRVTYPLYLSSGVGAARTADAMTFVASQGWRAFSLLTSLDVAGRSFRDYVVGSYFTSFTIDQQTFSPTAADQDATLDTALQNIMRLDNRIIVIKANAPSGMAIYQALIRAGMLNNPRYVILGQQFVSALSQLSGTAAGNVMTVLQPPPTPAQVATYTPAFTRQLSLLNMTSAETAACMSYLASRASFIPPIFNSVFTMAYTAGVVWNSSVPITIPNMFRAMSAVNIPAAFGTPVRYDHITGLLHTISASHSSINPHKDLLIFV